MPVLALVPKLDALAAEGWWEVQAQLGTLCGELLAPSRADHLDEMEAAAIAALLGKALGNRCAAAQAVILSAAAPVLAASPVATRPVCRVAPRDAAGAARALLAPADARADRPLDGGRAALRAHAPAGVADVPRRVRADGRGALALARHARAAVPRGPLRLLTPPALASPSGAGDWAAWLNANKDYLYVALCDEELCQPVAECLKPLFALLREDALPSFSTLLSSLRMVCDHSPALCATVATDFLLALYDKGEPFTGALRNLVTNFDATMRGAFTNLVSKVEAA